MEIIEKFKNELKRIEESLKTELFALRVGRATPALVENILVDYYGSKTPLKQIASISAPEPQVLVIEPWDKNIIGSIEKAILTSDLGLSLVVNKHLIRINIPPLTEERKSSLMKIVGAKLEEAKIKTRSERDEIIKKINDRFNNKAIAEDEKFKTKEKAQESVNNTNKNLENMAKAKEKEIKET